MAITDCLLNVASPAPNNQLNGKLNLESHARLGTSDGNPIDYRDKRKGNDCLGFSVKESQDNQSDISPVILQVNKFHKLNLALVDQPGAE